MICALVLAAGRSRRMGTQKLLLSWQGQPLIAHIVDEVLRSPVDETVVVTGPDSKVVACALAERKVRLVTNPNPDSEMLDSVRCGVRVLPKECEAALLVLGDQPRITNHLIRGLIETYRSGPWNMVAPTHNGRRGHPLLFSMRYRDEVLSHYDDAGLRGLLLAHPDAIGEMPIDNASVLEDLDAPADYERMTGAVPPIR